MHEEKLDIYDENNKPLGISKFKSLVKQDGDYYRIVILQIYNKNGFLLQFRSKNKVFNPGKISFSVGGYVLTGEYNIQAVVREAKEEIGLDIYDIDNIILIKEYKSKNGKAFDYIYRYYRDGKIEDLTLQEEEVDSVYWIGFNELKQDIANNFENKYVNKPELWNEIIELINTTE